MRVVSGFLFGRTFFERESQKRGGLSMANLDKHDDQEAWLAWAIQFMTRGLYPVGDIEIHGPHAPQAISCGDRHSARTSSAAGIMRSSSGHVVAILFGTFVE